MASSGVARKPLPDRSPSRVAFLRQPSPSHSASNQSSVEYLNSHEEVIHVKTHDAGPSQPTAGSVPGAPPRSQHVVAENLTQATNRSLRKLTPKVMRKNVEKTDPDFDDLTFWPTILQAKAVTLLVLFYTATALSLVFLVWKSQKNINQKFELSSENVRMISRYFPSIIGTVTTLLFRQTIREALRMKPFTSMADQGGTASKGLPPSKGVGGAWFPWQSVTTTPWSFLSSFSFLSQLVVSFVVSFKAALLASSDVIIAGTHHWELTVRLYPAVFLVCMYILMILYTLFVAWHYRGKSTGLKWDPVSIADYACLFAHCNVLKYFAPLELRHDLRPEHVMEEDRQFRLGYWTREFDDSEETDVVYGIGVVYDSRRDTGLSKHERDELGRTLWQKVTGQKPKPKPLPLKQCNRKDKCAHGTWPKCEHYPYNENPGCSRRLIVITSVFPIIALGFSVYALVARLPENGFSLDNSLRIPGQFNISAGQHTWHLPPIDPADPKSDILVWALLFRSLPTYMAGLFVSTIVTWIDLNMRFMQPFRNMFGKYNGPKLTLQQRIRRFFGWTINVGPPGNQQPLAEGERDPAEASESILLAYITVSPLQVPLTAWDKGHFKVCIYSILNTLSPLFPIFVGALVTVSPLQKSRDDEVKRVQFTFSLSAYIGTMVSLALYSILLPAAMPGAHRQLPRQLYSLADLMALCHESKFMESPHLNIADKERTPSKQHMEARILMTDDRFLFGQYKGRDSQRHIGFDVTQTREEDFGKIIRLRSSVRHIPPKGFASIVQRTYSVMAEEGRRAATAIAGVMAPARANPFSQRHYNLVNSSGEVHELQTTNADASGSEVYNVGNSGRTRIPRSIGDHDTVYEPYRAPAPASYRER